MALSQNIFESIGGEFLLPQYKISEKLHALRAFVFDWDGVFNKGEKSATESSSFTEVDSMGTNLLRFAYFLKNQKLPYTAILSGEKNETAFMFAKREHFNASYSKIPNKIKAFEHFCEVNALKPLEVCYFFDDVLDLPVARQAGLRIFIPRKATLQFTNYVKQNHYADYITGSTADQYAIRESCEMLMTALGLYERAISLRISYDEQYRNYIAARNSTPTDFFSLSNEVVAKLEL